MEELLELKELLRQKEVESALLLVEDLEEMGRKAIVRTIRSYAKVLLLHLIKQQVEQRSTKSWDASIRSAIREIKDINARPKGRGFYLNAEDLAEAITNSFDSAVEQAAIETAEGIYDFRQIEQMVCKEDLVAQALYFLTEEDMGSRDC